MSDVAGKIFGDSLSGPYGSSIYIGKINKLWIFHRYRLQLIAKRVGNWLQQRTMRRNWHIQPLRLASPLCAGFL